jgi:hypothetical protein
LKDITAYWRIKFLHILQEVRGICKTRNQLLDNYLRDFDQDYPAAWEGVKALIAARAPYGRVYSGTGEEFFDYPLHGKKEVFIPKLLGDALLDRHEYCYTARGVFPFFRSGF